MVARKLTPSERISCRCFITVYLLILKVTLLKIRQFQLLAIKPALEHLSSLFKIITLDGLRRHIKPLKTNAGLFFSQVQFFATPSIVFWCRKKEAMGQLLQVYRRNRKLWTQSVKNLIWLRFYRVRIYIQLNRWLPKSHHINIKPSRSWFFLFI